MFGWLFKKVRSWARVLVGGIVIWRELANADAHISLT